MIASLESSDKSGALIPGESRRAGPWCPGFGLSGCERAAVVGRCGEGDGRGTREDDVDCSDSTESLGRRAGFPLEPCLVCSGNRELGIRLWITGEDSKCNSPVPLRLGRGGRV